MSLDKKHPGGRYILSEEEIKEAWRRIDEAKKKGKE
jgi:hypothetical protein